MIQKIAYLMISISVGFVFYKLNIPAGWLLGSLMTGIFCGIFIIRFTFKRTTFKLTLTFIGANISLLLSLEILKKIHHFILPLLFIVFILIAAGFLFSTLLYKKAKEVDKMTAFFCCIPGGATEIIGLSGLYDADERLVAAFHSVRIVFFTMSIPLLISIFNSPIGLSDIDSNDSPLSALTMLFFLVVMTSAFFLDRTFKIPGGTLLFSILIGFLITQFIVDINQVPKIVTGIGQALIGAFVGIRFDRGVLRSLWKAGPITIIIILMLFVLTLMTSFLFKVLTGLAYSTSLISIVPAGAAEMTVTAIALGVEPTIVASLHIIRLITIFLLLPLLLKIFKYFNKIPELDHVKENNHG